MITSEKVKIFPPKGERKLYSLLKSFGIECTSISMEEKRFFDVYDIRLAGGVRSSKIDRVLTDIGMSMSSCATPRGYPVMRDGIYRVEVQREEISPPDLQDVCSHFPSNCYAPIALGMDDLGEYFCADLNSMPNLLIGGTTGSGKSVLLHSIILSLLTSDADLYLVDPKMVEFGIYESMAAVKSVETSLEDTEQMIYDIRAVMEARFLKLKSKSARNVVEYNKIVKPANRMSPIVIVVDEWADLVLQSKDIQKPLCAVAQKGRAAGISIVLATQRPSVRVVSGLIKANFPGRISLKVASAVDSRVILDSKGAENLTDVGMGLYIDGRLSKPKLFRAPFIESVSDELLKFNFAKKAKTTFWNRFLS
jgi:DNA segregation ATPase FtsK/SpoIIIE, S-DNA-T family